LNPGVEYTSETVCFIIMYDLTSSESFDCAEESFTALASKIDRTFQYIFLVASKHDEEEYR
jgi:GTPase SAR1 family protein